MTTRWAATSSGNCFDKKCFKGQGNLGTIFSNTMNRAQAKLKVKLASRTGLSSPVFWSLLFCRLFLDAFNFVRVVGHGESLQRDPSRPLSPLDPETIAINPFDDTLNRLPVQQGNLDSIPRLRQ